MLIVNGTVHTMENGTIPSGFVLVKDRRIVQVGPMSGLPENAGLSGVIDAQGAISSPASSTPTAILGCMAPFPRRTI